MPENNSKNNRNSMYKKRTDSNGVKTEGTSEIGFHNNKNMVKGKKGGIVGKG